MIIPARFSEYIQRIRSIIDGDIQQHDAECCGNFFPTSHRAKKCRK